MALIKEKTVKSFVAKYWIITFVRIDFVNRSVKAELRLFKDQEAREFDFDIENSIDREVRTFPFPDMTIKSLSELTLGEMCVMLYNRYIESDPETTFDLETGKEVIIERNWFADAIVDMEI